MVSVLGYLLIPVTGFLTETTEEGISLDSQFWGIWSITKRKAWQLQLGLLVTLSPQSGHRSECWPLSSNLLFIQPRTPAFVMILPTSRVVFPHSVKSLWKQHNIHVQRRVLQMILSPIKLTMKATHLCQCYMLASSALSILTLTFMFKALTTRNLCSYYISI